MEKKQTKKKFLEPKCPLTEIPFVVFDTETTGLSLTSRIIEVGAVKVQGGRKIDEFSSLANPQRPIPNKATEIHGITDEMVANAPPLPKVLEKFCHFIDGAILVAHNAVFDLRMLAFHLERERMPLFSNPTVDTHTLMRKYFPQLEKYNLPFLVQFWQSPYKGSHRALVDAQHTAFIFFRLLEKNGFLLSDPLENFWKWAGKPLYVKNYLPKPLHNPSEPKLEIITKVIQSGKDLMIIYANGHLAFKPRLVHPIICFQCGKHYYMEAFCYTDQIVKTFRVDRILKILRNF